MRLHGVLKTGCIFYKLKFAQVATTLYFKFISLLDENNSKYRCISYTVQVEKYEAGEGESEIQLVPGSQWDILQFSRLLFLFCFVFQYLKVKSRTVCFLHLDFRILDLRCSVQCALPSENNLSIYL